MSSLITSIVESLLYYLLLDFSVWNSFSLMVLLEGKASFHWVGAEGQGHVIRKPSWVPALDQAPSLHCHHVSLHYTVLIAFSFSEITWSHRHWVFPVSPSWNGSSLRAESGTSLLTLLGGMEVLDKNCWTDEMGTHVAWRKGDTERGVHTHRKEPWCFVSTAGLWALRAWQCFLSQGVLVLPFIHSSPDFTCSRGRSATPGRGVWELRVLMRLTNEEGPHVARLWLHNSAY